MIQRSSEIAGQSILYSLIVKAFTSLLGEGPLQLRLPSVFFGSALLLLVYPLAMRLLKDRRAALTSVLVFALSERLIFYSQNARPYALALFLTLLSFLCFIGATGQKKPMPKIRYVAATTLLVYSHLVFALIALVQATYVILSVKRRKIVSTGWLFLFGIIALLCSPVAHQFLGLYAQRYQLDWISHINQSNIAFEIAIGLLTICPPLVFILTAGAVIAIGCLHDAVFRSADPECMRICRLWLTLPIAVFSLTPLLLDLGFFHNRYFLLVYPAAFFLLASFFSRVETKGRRKWIPVLVFVVTSFGFVLIPAFVRSNSFSYGTQWDWAGAAQVLAAAGDPADLVVFRTGHVEADFFAAESPPAYLGSYVGWPILAHLPSQKSFTLVSLPFRLTDRSRTYWISVQNLASSHSRFWVIGEGALTDSFVDIMIAKQGFYRVHHSAHRNVQVTLLQKLPRQ